MDDKKHEAALQNVFTIFLAVAVGIFCVVAGAYFLRFGVENYSFSKDSKDWAEFGEYMGGTLGGVFGLFAFVGLLITILQQRADNQRVVKATLDAVTAAHQLQTKSRQKSILAIADAANEHARRIEDAIGRTDEPLALYEVYHKTIIDGVVRALTDVPVYEVGGRDGVMAILSLRDQFVFLAFAVEAYMAPPASDPLIAQAIESLSGPEYAKQRREVLTSNKKILANNVRIHLTAIHNYFDSLKKSLDVGRGDETRSGPLL